LSGHDAVAEVAVFGVDDEEFGQRLKAVVVKRDGASLSEDDVKKLVKSNLAGYKVPRDVEFVDELPRTSTGKVLKRELKGEGEEGEDGGGDGKSNGKSDAEKSSGASAKKSSGGAKEKTAGKG